MGTIHIHINLIKIAISDTNAFCLELISVCQLIMNYELVTI